LMKRLENSQAPKKPGRILRMNFIPKPMRVMRMMPNNPPKEAPTSPISQVTQNSLLLIKLFLDHLMISTEINEQAM